MTHLLMLKVWSLSNCILFVNDLDFLYVYLEKKLLQFIYNVLPISATQQSDPVIYTHTHTHTHTFSLSCCPLSCSITSDWIQFPVIYSRTSLPIHSKSIFKAFLLYVLKLQYNGRGLFHAAQNTDLYILINIVFSVSPGKFVGVFTQFIF